MWPHYMVQVDGADITGRISSRLLTLSVTLKPGRNSDTFELLVDDTDDLIDPPRKGAKVKIWMGYVETGLTYMGEYTVDDIGVSITPQELKISGKAADMRATAKSQRTRHFDNKTLKDVYGQIAKDEGLKLSIDSTIGAIKVPYEAQTEESNLHLMTRLGDKYGAIAKVGDGQLSVTKRGSGTTASGKPMVTILVTRQDIKKGNGKLKDRPRFGSVSATWHNQKQARKQEVKENQGEGPNYSLRHPFQTEEEARAACKAKLAEMQRAEADLSYSTIGDVRYDAETKLKLVGVSRKLDGDWIVKQVRHTLRGSSAGFETQVEAETPGQRKETKGGGKT